VEETPEWFDARYLATDDPRAQSGFTGSEARWEAARRAIVRGIDAPGTFLDVGCANGLLMESAERWSASPIEAWGVDFAPGLVALAKRRFGDRVFEADIATWTPPRAFDFVHVRLDMLDLRDVRAFGRRIIVSSDGSFRRPESPKARNVTDVLRARGWNVDGCYERSDEHLVEISVAWTR
jgi:SAM-dependent methyltransferase